MAERSVWVAPTSDLRGAPLIPPDIVAARMQKEILRMVKFMREKTEEGVSKFFAAPDTKEFVAMDESIASSFDRMMQRLEKSFSQLFDKKAQGLALEMLKGIDTSTKNVLKRSLKDVSAGLTLKIEDLSPEMRDVMKLAAHESAALIKSIPEQYIGRVRSEVVRTLTSTGDTPKLMKQLMKFGDMSERRAELIAADQSKKTFSKLTELRLKKIGVEKFEWVHSGGGRTPRPHHIAMYPKGLNRGVFDLNNPPVIDPETGERGLPGQLPNCKCFMRPVIDFEEEEDAA